MTALYLCLVVIFITCTLAQETICLWGRYGKDNRVANGLYRRGPEMINGEFYYKLDRTGQECGSQYYWLFFISEAPRHGWYIGVSSTTNFGFGISNQLIAKCRGSDNTSPVSCGANWVFWDPYSTGTYPNENFPSAQIDANFTSNWGRCPQLDCETISVTDNGYNTCWGSASQIGANVYQGSGWIWWFNEPRFYWVCTSTAVGHTCNDASVNAVISNVAPIQEWFDLSNGETATYDDTGSSTGTFTCSGVSTTTTFLPTTPFPTIPDIPTPYPSFITQAPSTPTSNPSVATGAPSDDPTLAPGSNPALNPGLAPTDDDNVSSGDDDDDEQKDSMIEGLPDLWFWIIIGILVLILCCCICCCCYFMKKSKDKKKNDDQFGGDW